ncbi:MAG: DUF3791 domain-containing protein [Clostridium neonatale]
MEVYKILNDTETVDNYIIECYDVIPTLCSEYLMEDITDVLKERGISLR